MIAPAHQTQSIDAGFLAMLPAIRRYARQRFRHLRPAACEEAVAEAVAAAFSAYRRLTQLGRRDLIYATPLAKYAALHVRNGRHVGGQESSRDVLSRTAQLRRGFQVESIEQFDHQDRQWVAGIVVEDRRATPAEVAAARLDVADWLARLPKFKRRVAKTLGSGETTGATAKRHGVTAGRVSQMRREFERSWRLFQGELCAA
jgi:hypothetical protein